MGVDQLYCVLQTKVLCVQVALRMLDDSIKECAIMKVET